MEKNKPMQSIQWRLPATYAAIALLTAAALGAALLIPLRGYYLGRERNFLQSNAQSIADALAPVMAIAGDSPVNLAEHIRFLAVLSQTRVRLLDTGQHQVADSGAQDGDASTTISYMSISVDRVSDNVLVGVNQLSETITPLNMLIEEPSKTEWPQGTPSTVTIIEEGTLPLENEVSIGVAGIGPDDEQVNRLRFIVGSPQASQVVEETSESEVLTTSPLIAMIPLAGTMYGFELQNASEQEAYHSDQVHLQPITGTDGKNLGWVELSEGPAYGREIVNNVARGWLAASLIAILLAAMVGLLVSRQMTGPLLALTGVARRMADGDLSARIDLQRVDEIGSLGQAFNEMANRVESTVGALRHFASDAAHELHTPLTALHTNLELAFTSSDPAEYLKPANEQLQRVEDLTIDLLDLSRIETDMLGTANEDVHLLDLLRETSEQFASQAEQAGVDFSLDLPECDLIVEGQRGQLQCAIKNLVENACKFTLPGGQVVVGLREVEDEAHICVEDNGIGIAPEDVPLIFNRFHRGRNTAGYSGSGLGLSIVRAIAEHHRGRIWLENREDRTRFILALPLKI